MKEELQMLEGLLEKHVFSDIPKDVERETLRSIAFRMKQLYYDGDIPFDVQRVPSNYWHITPFIMAYAGACGTDFHIEDMTRNDFEDLFSHLRDNSPFHLDGILSSEIFKNGVDEARVRLGNTWKKFYWGLNDSIEGIHVDNRVMDYDCIDIEEGFDNDVDCRAYDCKLYVEKKKKDDFQSRYFEKGTISPELAERLVTESREHCPSLIHFPIFSFTKELPEYGLFIKWVDPTRVEVVDHEADIAERLGSLGIMAPEYYGYVEVPDMGQFTLAENLEGIDFKNVKYSDNLLDYTGHKEFNPYLTLAEFISQNEGSVTQARVKEVVRYAYETLGKDMRKLVDSGVFLGDSALRNFMLCYKDKKPQVYFVDFEKTKFTGRELIATESFNMLEPIRYMGKVERAAFERGYGD